MWISKREYYNLLLSKKQNINVITKLVKQIKKIGYRTIFYKNNTIDFERINNEI